MYDDPSCFVQCFIDVMNALFVRRHFNHIDIPIDYRIGLRKSYVNVRRFHRQAARTSEVMRPFDLSKYG